MGNCSSKTREMEFFEARIALFFCFVCVYFFFLVLLCDKALRCAAAYLHYSGGKVSLCLLPSIRRP